MSLMERLEKRTNNTRSTCAVASAAARLPESEREALYALVDLRNDAGEFRFSARTVADDIRAEGVLGVGEVAVRVHRLGSCPCPKS